MSELTPIVVALVATLGGGGLSALAALVTRRFVEPSRDEISQAETYASEVWFSGKGDLVVSHGSGTDRPAGSRDSGVGRSTYSAPRGGDAEALRILTEFAEDLRGEADRIAKRAGAESASATHVRLAADRIGILRQSASALADIGLAVGALILGAAISYEINLVTGADASPGSAQWVIAAGAAGLSIFVIAATVKWVSAKAS